MSTKTADTPVISGSRHSLVVAGYLLSAAVQVTLCALGVAFFLLGRRSDRLDLLLPWCVIGTLYLAVAVTLLAARARRPESTAIRPPHLEVSRAARLISLITTMGASLIGAGAALLLVGLGSDARADTGVVAVGVWAMILSWALLHWGFTQLYYQNYWASRFPSMRFPQTRRPRLTEFAYFSFTIGTSFAASDVDVQTSGARMWVVAHSVISFFFNGLIIVFALNTILAPGPQ